MFLVNFIQTAIGVYDLMLVNKLKGLEEQPKVQRKKFLNKDEDHNIKRLPTKIADVVTSKGVYQRHQHILTNGEQPKGEHHNNQPNESKDKFNFDEKSSKTLGVVSRGASEGIEKIEANDTFFYAKPVAGESWVYLDDNKQKVNVRNTIKLNSKQSGQEIPLRSVMNFLGEEKKDVLIGTMADREHMASRLSHELGFTHIPEAQKKMYNGKEQSFVEDVHEKYKNDFKKVQSDLGIEHEKGETVLGAAAKDPHIHDKIMLDLLMGNTDRHDGNMFIGEDHNGGYTMLGIDHGLSFPNDNKKYMEGANKPTRNECGDDFYNQYEFSRMLDMNKITKEFYNRLSNQGRSGEGRKFVKDIATNIGKKESQAFLQRFQDTVKKIRKKRGQE